MYDDTGLSRTRYRDREVYALPRLSKIRSPHHRMHFGVLGTIVAILLVLAGLSTWFGDYQYGTETNVVFTVKSLGNNVSGNSHQYIVFTEVPGTTKPAEVFKDTDALFHLKFHSSDLYESLTPGKTYQCTVYGWRNGFFSAYRDLLKCRRISVSAALGKYREELVKPVSS